MENITLRDLVEYTKGSASEDLDLDTGVSAISNNGRTVGEQWVYLALKGERLDGHRFVAQAEGNGAIASIVEISTGSREIVVENSYKAIKDIAMRYRKKFEIPYVAVTGSSGKTTTKDMIFYALDANKKTLRNIGNLNSEIGLPLTVLNMDSSIELCVLEMGMYTFGEIDYLAEIARPHIAVITNVGTAHIRNLGTRENILKAKLEIVNYMTASDILLINGDNDMLQTVESEKLAPRVLRFGLSKKNDIYPEEYRFVDGKTELRAFVLGESVQLILPTVGEHNICNALSALAVAKLLDLDLTVAARGLESYRASSFRMERFTVNAKTIINDCYNANPDSMRAALSTLQHFGDGRRVAILADMLELGENTVQYHLEIGEFAAQNVQLLIAVGKDAVHIAEGARNAGMAPENIRCFENNPSVIAALDSLLEDGDIVMLKGSRGMKLEEVAEQIR